MDLSPPARAGAADFVRGVLDLRRMAGAALEPLRVATLDAAGAARVPAGFERAFEAACDGLGVRGLRLAEVGPEALDSFERIAEGRLALDAVAAAAAAAPEDELAGAIEAAAAGSSQARFAAGTIQAPDGAHLSTFAHGDDGSVPVVLIQALGMPVELAHDLLLHLGDRARLHTWEVRGAFHLEDDFDSFDVSLAAEVADLVRVLDHFGLQRVHLLAFCIGAPLAMRAAADHPERFASVTLVNGGFGLADARTEYEQQFHSVFPKVGQGRPAAQLFHKLFRGAGGAKSTGLAIDDPHAHLIYLPYVHPESLYRYGATVTPLLQADVLAWVGELRTPCLFVATDRDPVSDPRAARIVCERVQDGELVELTGDRHLALMDTPAELARVWLPFVARHPAG